MKFYIVSVYKKTGKLGNSVTTSKICISPNWKNSLWNFVRNIHKSEIATKEIQKGKAPFYTPFSWQTIERKRERERDIKERDRKREREKKQDKWREKDIKERDRKRERERTRQIAMREREGIERQRERIGEKEIKI